MARGNSLQQAKKLEEQIRKLQEKQKLYIEKAQKEIGQYLMEAWDVEDIDQAKALIDSCKNEVNKKFEKKSSEEIKKQTEVEVVR